MLDAEAANIAQVAGAFVVTILLLLYTSIFYVSKKEATLIFDITPYLLRHFYNFYSTLFRRHFCNLRAVVYYIPVITTDVIVRSLLDVT